MPRCHNLPAEMLDEILVGNKDIWQSWMSLTEPFCYLYSHDVAQQSPKAESGGPVTFFPLEDSTF